MSTELEKWVEEQAKLTLPDKIYWCDGSEEEAHRLIKIGLTKEKINHHYVFYELNHNIFPNSYLHRSHPTDVARTEHLTFVNHPKKELSGPTSNWMEPKEAKKLLYGLFKGCMRGRTMYVVPYVMGHPASSHAKTCVQLTDSVYVAVNMRIMTRMGREALKKISASEDFVKGLHSIGELDPERRFIMHFPHEKLVMSYGSGYGGNALLGKKCFSLRIASYLGELENWLAEHMIIIGVEEPDGSISYITGAFPSASGKTNLALLDSVLSGYKVWTIGDDIAWLYIGDDKKLYALNPETGFFGVAPNTSYVTNPNIMRTLKEKGFYPTLFTNCGLDTRNNAPWWEGLELDNGFVPRDLVDWQGEVYNPDKREPVAHPNARFTVSIYNAPTLSKEFDNPQGVPVSAIIFGVRRSTTLPLVVESFNWQHGVFLASIMGTETTAAAAHMVGVVRRDPFAMIPFCGYNMGSYFAHWLKIGSQLPEPPRLFFVNWFRRDENDKFLWPGFRENIRILKWIIDRTKNRVKARETPLGMLPFTKDLDLSGLHLRRKDIYKLFAINPEEWATELLKIKEFYSLFGDKLPGELWQEFNNLKKKLKL